MVATLGLLGQISDNNINVRTAYGQDMGIKGSIMVNFKIGPSSFAHKFVLCEGLTRPFILGDKFLSHCYITTMVFRVYHGVRMFFHVYFP